MSLNTKSILDVTRTDDCKTPEELMHRILDYIGYKMREGYPTRLSTMSRRFSAKASKLQVSVRDLVNKLADSGSVVLYDRRNNIVLVDQAFLNLQAEYVPDERERAEALEMMLDRAQ